MKKKRSAGLYAAGIALAVVIVALVGINVWKYARNKAPEPTETPSAPPTEPTPDGTGADVPGIDFSNGKFGFLMSYEASPDACKTELSIISRNGKNALLLDVSSGGTPYIALDASSLLGDDVARLYTMELDIETVPPGEEFFAVSGALMALSGENLLQSMDPWSVYLPNKNPNVARATLATASEKFVPNAYNMFIISKDVDNGVSPDVPPSNLIILGIRFFDEAGVALTPDPEAGFNAPEGFGKPDKSNLESVDNETVIPGAAGESAGGWGQAVTIPTAKNGGAFEVSLLTPDSVVTVYYTSDTAPELILQSWTDGKPDQAGWAKVAPAYVNDSGTAAQFRYADMVEAFGTDDLETYLDQVFVGDTGEKLSVFSVTIALENGGDAQ